MNAITRRTLSSPAALIRATVLIVACMIGASSASALELTPLASAAATSSVTSPNPRDTLARQMADPVFDTALRDQLVSAARYPALPDPNRPAPRGKTTVTFEITPDGRVTDAAITEWEQTYGPLVDGLRASAPGPVRDLRVASFVAAVFGGIGSLHGAVVGGFLLGLGETYLIGYGASTYRDAFSFIILILVLLIKPTGLFGITRKEKI